MANSWSRGCHSERSEESPANLQEIYFYRFAQDDWPGGLSILPLTPSRRRGKLSAAFSLSQPETA